MLIFPLSVRESLSPQNKNPAKLSTNKVLHPTSGFQTERQRGYYKMLTLRPNRGKNAMRFDHLKIDKCFLCQTSLLMSDICFNVRHMSDTVFNVSTCF